ncbi:uncharacterized protein BX664DRAFT_383873 [Halteromyces radiatus]|uniref:uncharacterized protein n=1 Tax=Halteromyces radiatus TaxID=101107 RepID=UPI00221F3367|nr:uncharacterized protein BX664DRAFT_383873 [Halteromyces radiatus]KAI8097616.1 hypothetical protein BX664DRAFT_383873 [Halteromyces radiatus]
MIDCSNTEISGLRSIFNDGVTILLCHWHIKRVWEKNLTSKVMIKYETRQLLDVTRIKLNDMMHAVSNLLLNAVFHTNKFTIIQATYSAQLTQPGGPYLDIDKKELLNERIRQF